MIDGSRGGTRALDVWSSAATLGRWLDLHASGLIVVVVLSVAARVAALALPEYIAEVTVGILIGLGMGNLAGLPRSTTAGIKFAAGTPLRLGIVLLGARLSFGDVLDTGVGALVMIVACMAFALALVVGLARMLALPPRLATLIAVGTAVCGNSAIIATAPVIEADERDVSFAVATITVFGTLAVFAYPLIGHALGFSDRFFGHWAGVAVNDTSQVTAAGFAYSVVAGETATIIKLTRNTLMGPLILLIGAIYARSGAAHSTNQVRQSSRARFVRFVPLFVIGFLGMATLNSLGIIPSWLSTPIADASRALILCALVAVGLSTNFRQIRNVGLRPFYLGLLAAIAVSALALTLGTVLIGQ